MGVSCIYYFEKRNERNEEIGNAHLCLFRFLNVGGLPCPYSDGAVFIDYNEGERVIRFGGDGKFCSNFIPIEDVRKGLEEELAGK